MAERRSNKERVLAKWPDAWARIAGPRYWQIKPRSDCGIETIGEDRTELKAWAHAASRLSTKGK